MKTGDPSDIQSFTAGALNVRPIVSFGQVPSSDSLEGDIVNFSKSLYYFELFSFFKDYPAHSLLSKMIRCMLYYIIRRIGAKAVCEIGTYRGGTTEVLARAMHENGGGVVHTIDPIYNNEVRENIGHWPTELQRLVKFYHGTSMGAYISLEDTRFDLFFIDGGHAHEVALFDLHMAGTMSNDGAVIVLDNCDQPSVLWAVKDFLATRPDWVEVGDSLSRHTGAAITEAAECFANGLCLILMKQPGVHLGPHPYITFVTHEHQGLSGLGLSVRQGAAGVLRGVCYLRVFGEGYVFCEHRATFEHRFDGTETDVDVPFDPDRVALRCLKGRAGHEDWVIDGRMYYGHRPEEIKRTVEIVLFWEAEGDDGGKLVLEREPSLIPMEAAA